MVDKTVGKVISIGIDAGSTTTKVVAVDGNGDIIWHHLEETDPKMEEQARRLLAKARKQLGVSNDIPLIATGYGRKLIPETTKRITEITCHAKGVFKCMGHGGTLIDIGGQDSKVIILKDGGEVVNFVMNDKCAAGTGRFLEVIANRLRISLDEMSNMAVSEAQSVPISSTCTVFAESEIVSLIARGNPMSKIIRGLHEALVRRIAALAKSAGVAPPVILSGGVAQSVAVQKILSHELNTDVALPLNPQLMGAYGAALAGGRS